MNKLTKIAATSLLAFTLLAPGLAAADNMKAMVDYSKVEMMKKDNMDIVPLRQLAESFGFKVTWDGMDRSITLTLGGMKDDTMGMAYSVIIQIDSNHAMVGTTDNMLAFAPTLINNKTYVSKDFIEMYLANQMMMK